MNKGKELCLFTNTDQELSQMLSSRSSALLGIVNYHLQRGRCEERLARIRRTQKLRKSAAKAGTNASAAAQASPKPLDTEQAVRESVLGFSPEGVDNE